MNHNEIDHKTGYQPALDGIRGLAIIMVITSHFFYTVRAFQGGWMGVDLFFVLSGYLIASKFIRKPLTLKLVKIFFRNRALRILPLYLLFIAVFFCIGLLLPEDKKDYLYTPNVSFFWERHLLLLQNWIYVFSMPGSGAYNPLFHLWSIAVEEQFYLVFPLLIALLGLVKRKIWILIVAILLIAVFRSVDYNFHHLADGRYRYYCNTFFRLDTFLTGILLAVVLHQFKEGDRLYKYFLLLFFLSLGLYLAGVIYYNGLSSENPFISTVGYTIIALLFMSLLYFVVIQRSAWLNRIFTNRFLVFSGKISYGLYIFHYAVDYFSYSVQHKYFKFLYSAFNERTASLVFTFLLLALLYLVCYISYVTYESYFLRMKKRYY